MGPVIISYSTSPAVNVFVAVITFRVISGILSVYGIGDLSDDYNLLGGR